MAKIKLRNGDNFEVDNGWAEVLNKSWLDRTISGTTALEVMPGRFELKNQIVNIEFGDRKPGALDLNDPIVREMVKKVERELEAIGKRDPEKAQYAFDWWCVERGYYIKAKTERIFYSGAFGGTPHWYKRPENYSVRQNANEAVAIKNALDSLRERRFWAKKQEHLGELEALKLEKCPLDKKNPCKFCHPTAGFNIPRGVVRSISAETQDAQALKQEISPEVSFEDGGVIKASDLPF